MNDWKTNTFCIMKSFDIILNHMFNIGQFKIPMVRV